ncbi:MAG: FAD/NAD(P)-binding protein [Desulfobacteraceae bacterium]|nr:FAD/NAD(P)-binding protein [Desulfobacteraceae bacterium]
MKNPYVPVPMRIDNVVVETDDRDIKTFSLSFVAKEDEANFSYIPGQFAGLSYFGKGEAPFGMASSPTQNGCLEFSISKVGVVTTALHNMEEGEIVGVRGPLGNGYPLKALEGHNIVMIGGGFGFSTLRALTNFMLDNVNRPNFSDISVIYGARRPGLLLYKNDLEKWGKRSDLHLYLTVDSGEDEWVGMVGLIPQITKEVAPSSENAYALICGPPAMIKFTLPVIKELGFPPDRTLLSLEMKMKCGVGMCGRCNIGSKYVCRDGPVFSCAQLSELTSNEY